MNENTAKNQLSPLKPISVGLTCWLWDWSRARTIVQLAHRTGVTLELTQHIHGLRREIECTVWGDNVDRFMGEFGRQC